jgi:dipeptidyl aminopeptidase/acylaminoacyl peptidase
MKRFVCLLIPTLWTLSLVSAHSTPPDFSKARALRELTENKVFRDRVQPHWNEAGTEFWYQLNTGAGTWEFIRVKASEGVRLPAFDHARLAQALALASNGVPNAVSNRLALTRLEFKDETLKFDVEGRQWQWDSKSGAILALEPAHPEPLQPLDERRIPHASLRSGPDTTVTFVNRTSGTVELFWLSTEGERVSYGKIPAGERRSQHTFAGHVWLVTDGSQKTLLACEAEENADTLEITSTPTGKFARHERRHRGGPPPSRETAPANSPWTAFIKNHNVFVKKNEATNEIQLTTDGSEDHAYGEPFFWSPDAGKLVVLQTTKGDDRKVTLVESSPKDQLQPKVHTIDYAKPGDRLPIQKPHLFDPVAGREIPVSDALFENPFDLSAPRWEPDSSRFTFVYNQRGHQVLRIIGIDAATGKTSAIVDEHSDTFIDYSGKQFTEYLPETGEIIWMSERDGWNHLYLYDARNGTVKNQITKGEWVVRNVEQVDREKRQIWFRAGGIIPGQDPYQIHYARVNFDGSGLTLLTQGDGTHSIDFSPNREFYIDTYSRVDLPPVTELRRSGDGALVCALEKADWSALLQAGWRAPERFTAKGRDGQTDIYGVIMTPTHLDPAKHYPVLEFIYAGPQDSFVPKRFSSFFPMQEMAELGFIVVQIDGMGTANRSRKFHDVCWKNLVDAGFPDRILWIKAAAAARPWMDLSRVGLYGTSAGGQNALGGLLTHPEFYKAGVADCGSHDNRMDKIWWNEQWMGWPIGPHYEAQSNVTLAKNLQGKLLLMVGEMDSNVDPSSTMQVVNALIRADKDFELLVVPGAGHGVSGSPYGKRKLQEFFVRAFL